MIVTAICFLDQNWHGVHLLSQKIKKRIDILLDFHLNDIMYAMASEIL